MWCTEVYICRIKHLQGGQGGWQDDDGEGLHGRTFESRKGLLKRRIVVMKLKPLNALANIKLLVKLYNGCEEN